VLENDRRRIELMNGNAVVLTRYPKYYYGDEIGMGDNINLGDRNGCGERQCNGLEAGTQDFSVTEPEKLYAPLIQDAVYAIRRSM